MINHQGKIDIRPGAITATALLALWLTVVVLPALIGSNSYKSALEEKLQRKIQQIQIDLTAKGKEAETFLFPERVFRHLNRIDQVREKFSNYYFHDIPGFAEDRLTLHLPDLRRPGTAIDELERFNLFMRQYSGQLPAAIFHLEENPENCKIFINHSFNFASRDHSLLQRELAIVAARLNQRFKLGRQNIPDFLRDLNRSEFPAIYRFTGSINPIQIDYWRLSNSFSSVTDGRINILTVRFPGFAATERYLMLIFSENTLPVKAAIKSLVLQKHNSRERVRFGKSALTKLPATFIKKSKVVMLHELPYNFKQIFDLQVKIPSGLRPVICYESDFTSDLLALQQKSRRINLLVFLYIIAIPLAVGLILKTSTGRSLKTQVVITFMIASLLPVTGIFWVAVSYLQQSEEMRLNQAITAGRNQIEEMEHAFELQRLRQLIRIRYVCHQLAKFPAKDWRSLLSRIDPPACNFKIRKYLYYNFLLLDDRGREYMRSDTGSGKGEELRPMLLGDQLKLMLKFGSFSHLPPAEQNKLGQMADISMGLADQITDREMMSRLFADEGIPQFSTTIVRNQLYTSHFIRSNNQLLGIFNTIGNITQLLQMIGQLVNDMVLPTRTIGDGHQIDLEFYPVSTTTDRHLSGRLQYFPDGVFNVPDGNYHLASSMFANADSSMISRMEGADPHIFVSDLISDRQIFVLATVRSLPQPATGPIFFFALPVALIACLAISIGISSLLLAPLPPFFAAIRELERENFCWQVAVSSGDEFAALGKSFNQMTIKMQERKKMMQLVSKTAIEATYADIAEADLSPGIDDVTVLFSDIRNFTTITEQNHAEEVIEMLNDYLTLMTMIIEQHGGYVDKIIGDAIQAIFRNAAAHERVYSACNAAIAMRNALQTMNRERERCKQFTINNGIGISTGKALSGLVGSKAGKLDATVFGKPVQTAQYLESQSKKAHLSHVLIDSESNRILTGKITTLPFTCEDGRQAFQIKTVT